MGYEITLTDSNVVIPAANFKAAYEAVCELNDHDHLKSRVWGKDQPSFMGLSADFPTELPHVRAVLEGLGFDIYEAFDGGGDLEITGYDSKHGDEEHFLAALAPYVTAAPGELPTLQWRGEDGEIWRDVFIDGAMKVQTASIVWSPLE